MAVIGKVLFVDDEPRILQAYQRGLRRHFEMVTAENGDQALKLLETHGPFPVVVSDMRMPGMSGIELLVRIRERSPDTVRVMLTGNSDQRTAIDAVNEGDVFRFLNKPCTVETLARTLAEAFKHYRLLTAERDLLEQTVRGAAGALSEVLSMVNPEAFGRTTRVRRLLSDLAVATGVGESWEFDTAAMLSQIGCVVLPEELLRRVSSGAPLTAEERERFGEHAAIGAGLLAHIPRLEGVAEIIRWQEKGYDGSGQPAQDVHGEDIPLGARLLKTVLDFDRHDMTGLTTAEALARMKDDARRYDPKALTALEMMVDARLPMESHQVEVPRLEDGMILDQDIRTNRGILVVCKGQQVSPSVRERLMSFLNHGALSAHMLVSIVSETADESGNDPTPAETPAAATG